MNSSIPPQSDSSNPDAISIDAPVIELEELTPSEEEERLRLEEIVERSFVEAGRALKRLRDGKLYRSTHRTFSDDVGKLLSSTNLMRKIRKCQQKSKPFAVL
jgi:hypothetical protein